MIFRRKVKVDIELKENDRRMVKLNVTQLCLPALLFNPLKCHNCQVWWHALKLVRLRQENCLEFAASPGSIASVSLGLNNQV